MFVCVVVCVVVFVYVCVCVCVCVSVLPPLLCARALPVPPGTIPPIHTYQMEASMFFGNGHNEQLDNQSHVLVISRDVTDRCVPGVTPCPRSFAFVGVLQY